MWVKCLWHRFCPHERTRRWGRKLHTYRWYCRGESDPTGFQLEEDQLMENFMGKSKMNFENVSFRWSLAFILNWVLYQINASVSPSLPNIRESMNKCLRLSVLSTGNRLRKPARIFILVLIGVLGTMYLCLTFSRQHWYSEAIVQTGSWRRDADFFLTEKSLKACWALKLVILVMKTEGRRLRSMLRVEFESALRIINWARGMAKQDHFGFFPPQ